MTDSKPDSTPLPLSVVLPVYEKVGPEEFIRSYESVAQQSWPAEEIIVVFDGPVQPEIESFLAEQPRDQLTTIRFEENRGLSAALRAGYAAARHRWIARQDSDDLSLPDRFERQWPLVQSGKYAVVGGAMLEFDEDPSVIIRRRELPSEPGEIAQYAKLNNPMNHPTVILDRDAVAAVGGVQDLPYMEDYDLFARLLSHGYALRSTKEPVVLFNAGDSMFDRRTGSVMGTSERRMQANLVRYGLISRPRAVLNFALRQGYRRLPRPLLKRAYGILFDRKR
ncbi:glycosyltransferase [Gulosibacter macacae]|uniref:Glycosyltransferase n=1 Tax=Gulosibacter macacae TaxID=2488791 RepID=A0A3P3W1L2_9MICO|nr:glycosyltransferase [Gulosibacter macacae]RRJ86763.1 glycosyltransferase [Gulosibacter macacae]